MIVIFTHILTNARSHASIPRKCNASCIISFQAHTQNWTNIANFSLYILIHHMLLMYRNSACQYPDNTRDLSHHTVNIYKWFDTKFIYPIKLCTNDTQFSFSIVFHVRNPTDKNSAHFQTNSTYETLIQRSNPVRKITWHKFNSPVNFHAWINFMQSSHVRYIIVMVTDHAGHAWMSRSTRSPMKWPFWDVLNTPTSYSWWRTSIGRTRYISSWNLSR